MAPSGDSPSAPLPLTSELAIAELERLRKVLPPKRRELLSDLFERTRDRQSTDIDELRVRHGGSGKSENTTQKALADLRASLARDYYTQLRDHYVRGAALTNALVFFEVEPDRTISAIAIRPDADADRSAPRPAADGAAAERERARARFPEISCRYIKSNTEAMQYALDRLPNVAVFRDTHVRPRDPVQQYRGALLPDVEDRLRQFLDRDPANRMRVVVGRFFERNYVERLIAVAESHREQVDWCMLDHATPLMNFVILDYADNSSEVLFGFGRYEDSTSEAVFLSSEPVLVGEFQALMRGLNRSARHVPIEHIRARLDGKGTNPRIYGKWEEERYARSLAMLMQRGSRGDSERGDLRISTSYLRHFDDTKIEVIRRSLEAGLHVKLLVLNPENRPLVHARFGARDGKASPRLAHGELVAQIRQLNALVDAKSEYAGTLEIRYSDLMPSGFVAHSEEWAYVGLMLAGGPHTHGPMVRVPRRSDLWQRLYDEDWLPRWQKARPTPGEPPLIRDSIGSGALRNEALVAIEEKLPATAQVWIASPRLANVTGAHAPFADVVRQNAARGVRYRYLVPTEEGPSPEALAELQALFENHPDRLQLRQVPMARLFGRLMFPVSFVAYHPDSGAQAEVFMQWPRDRRQKWWLKLYDRKVVGTVLTIMRAAARGR